MTPVSPETMAREYLLEKFPASANIFADSEIRDAFVAGYSAALAEVKALRDAAQFLIDVRDGRSTAEYLGDKTEAAIRMIRAALVQLRTANGEKK
jgi:hypothetical protein